MSAEPSYQPFPSVEGLLAQYLAIEDESSPDQPGRWATDVAGWIDGFVKTFDPRRQPSFIPFSLFPRQREFISWLQEREANEEEGIAEKSRDVGFTWLCCAYAVHAWLYRTGVAIGFGSRKLELVDRLGDPDSIFEKMRIVLRNLPSGMLPSGFDIDKHAGHCKITNPSNGNSITGEGGDNIGRGGRKTIYFIDEAAFLERPMKIEAALSQTSNVKIWVSTPNGSGNTFHRKRFSGKLPVFTFHWRDDPRKGQEWYDKQKDTLDSIILAQEVDIDYTASLEGIVIPAKWVQAAVKLAGLLDGYEPIGKRIAALDVADEGKNKSVFIGRQGIALFAVESWSHLNTTQTAYKAKEYGDSHHIDSLVYDCIGVGAGVKGTYQSMSQKPAFKTIAVNVGDAPSDTRWPDGKTSKQRFKNLKAELWWLVRVRFEKTFEFVELDIEHPIDDLIALPGHHELIAQLSQPTYYFNETGKIQIESKTDLAKRGIVSPDFADALVLSYLPERPQWRSGASTSLYGN